MNGLSARSKTAVLAAIVAVALPLVTAGTSAAAAPACATSGLVVWVDTTGNGTAGSIYYTLVFTNLSGRSCTLYGYPGVSAVDLKNRQIGSAAGRNPQHASTTVTLANGGDASMPLQITEAGNYPSSTCRQVTAAGLRVYPPGQKASRVIPFPFSTCSRKGPRILHVEAIVKGLTPTA